MESSNPIATITQRITDLRIVADYAVASSDEAVSANGALGKIKTLAKELDAAKDLEIRPLLDQTKAVREKFKPAELMLEQAEKTLKSALLTFQRAEAKRIEADRMVAERAAMAERARLEEAARKEREKAEAKAAELRAAGKEERAEALLQAANASATAKETIAAVATAAPTDAPTKLAGFGTSERWRGKVVDLRAFMETLAAHTELDVSEFVTIKQSAIDRLASVYKAATSKALPGLTADKEDRVSARSS